ncbi:hypothetical protein D3C71_2016330 [compost metagenome]
MASGIELWKILENRGREKYNLGEEWEVYAINLKDKEIAEIGLGIKNDKGKWKKGKENRIEGMVIWSDLNDEISKILVNEEPMEL